MYAPAQKSFDVLHTFTCRENVIQASVNRSQTLLAFVLKDSISENSDASVAHANDELQSFYQPFIVEINNAAGRTPHSLLQMKRAKQVMVQFLWRKPSTFEKNYQDKFLVFIHEECERYMMEPVRFCLELIICFLFTQLFWCTQVSW